MHILPACLIWLAVQADPPGADVSGTVRDASTNEPVAGALVALGDAEHRAVTGADGRFSFRDVPAGPHHLSASRIGYAARTLHALVPGSGLLQIDIALRPEPVPLAQLDVIRERPLSGNEPVDSDYPDRRLTLAALRNHPSLAEPDAFRGLAGAGVVLDPEAPSGVHIRGGASDHTAYLLDGVPILSPYHAAGLFSAWNPDAIAEVHLAGAAPSPAVPDALSGTLVGVTRTPGRRLRMQSALSNTQARVTLDGPVGVSSASYLISWRSNLPAAIAVKDERSYVRAETGDVLARIGLDAFDGELAVLVYDSENEIGTGSLVSDGTPAGPGNGFDWHSRSAGARFRRAGVRTILELRAWHAQADASAQWVVAGTVSRMRASHDDAGIAAGLEHHAGSHITHAGVRLSRLDSDYRVRSDASGPNIAVAPATGIATAYAQHAASLGTAVHARAGASLSVAAGRVHFSPRAQLRADIARDLSWTLAYSRTHQFAQSLRNQESVVGQVFPADLLVASGDGGAAVAGSDQIVAAGTWQPRGAVRIGVQAFARRMAGIAIIAAGETDPFATDPFGMGRGSARGASIELAAGGARYGLLASYGWQRVRVRSDVDVFAPAHGTAHILATGLSVFPTATSSARIALSASTGRTGTTIAGPFEYESCNILDGGCEFAGSPRLDGAVGRERLPAYLRIDLGARQHWHLRARGRDHLVGLFATVTNVIGRRNVLTYAIDDETGRREAIEMVPRSPLIIGLDWRF